LKFLRIWRNRSGSSVSKPISTPTQPAFFSRASRASSWAALMLIWVTQRRPIGATASANSDAKEMSAAKLSSTKK